MATGQTRLVEGIAPKKSAVPGKIPTGTTIGEIFSNLPDRKLWGYDGLNVFEYGSNSYLALSGGTVTGNTRVIGNLSASTLFSGSTNLYNIFQQIGTDTQVALQPGTNTYTGGTANAPTVNVSALTINTLTVSGSSQLAATTATSISGGTVSGGTIYSGGTNLNFIFQPLGAVSANSNGTNTYTGGTFFNQTINVSALTINTLVASGTSQLAATTATSISGGTVSGGTIYSGGTNLYNIFATVNSSINSASNGLTQIGNAVVLGGSLTGDTTIDDANSGYTFNVIMGDVNSGPYGQLYVYCGQTALFWGDNSVGRSNAVFANDGGVGLFTTNSAGTNSSSIQISVIPQAIANNGNNTLIVYDPLFNKGLVYENDFSNNFTPESLVTKRYVQKYVTGITSAITISIAPGSNILTGGTSSAPIISLVASPSVNNLISSGTVQMNAARAVSLSAATLSGGTIYSGGTELTQIIQNFISGSDTYVQPGTNTYTGGTDFRPTVNISALTINTLTVSGASQLAAITATSVSGGTVSGGTIYSGGTNISNIFHQKNGYLLQKYGSVSGSTFAGSPRTAVVTFVTPFPGNYSVVITGEVNRTWTIESKTASGFTINSNASPDFSSSNIFWIAGEIGEGYR